jgi:hypothetical protein
MGHHGVAGGTARGPAPLPQKLPDVSLLFRVPGYRHHAKRHPFLLLPDLGIPVPGVGSSQLEHARSSARRAGAGSSGNLPAHSGEVSGYLGSGLAIIVGQRNFSTAIFGGGDRLRMESIRIECGPRPGVGGYRRNPGAIYVCALLRVEMEPAVRSLAIGFFLYSCFLVLNDTILERWKHNYGMLWNLLATLAYAASMLLWGWALRKELRQRASEPVLLSQEAYGVYTPEINFRLKHLNDHLSQFWDVEAKRP